MRPKSVLAWSGLLLAVLVPTALAYVNGGDFHSTLKDYQKKLKAGGWSTYFEAPMPANCDRTGEIAQGVKVTPADNPEYHRYVNQLVGRALQTLPKEKADKISLEAKCEIARLTRAALQNAVANKQESIKKGQIDSLRYEVGAFAFESYWETNYNKKREIHEKRSGLVPFVALKVVEAKDSDGK